MAGEYLHRDAFDIAEADGKDMFLIIAQWGTARPPRLFAAKARFDAFAERLRVLPLHPSDRMMQVCGRLFPSHLPKRIAGL